VARPLRPVARPVVRGLTQVSTPRLIRAMRVVTRPLRAMGPATPVSTSDAAPDVPGDSATDSGAGSGLWSMGYYAGYDSTSYPVSAIEWAGMTHIAVAFYSPTATGAFDESLSQGSAAQGATLGHAIVTAAHAHGVKAVASPGRADSRTQFLAATASGGRRTPSWQHRQAGNRLRVRRDRLRLESLETVDEPVLVDVMQKVRQRAPGLLLTIPVGSSTSTRRATFLGTRPWPLPRTNSTSCPTAPRSLGG